MSSGTGSMIEHGELYDVNEHCNMLNLVVQRIIMAG